MRVLDRIGKGWHSRFPIQSKLSFPVQDDVDAVEQEHHPQTFLKKGLVPIRYSHGIKPLSHPTWMADRSRQAMTMLRDTVDIDADLMSGVPVLKGTRFTIPQLLAEIADGRNVEEISKAFTLDLEQIIDFLHGLAIHLDRPVLK